jgi:hypothetical protein
MSAKVPPPFSFNDVVGDLDSMTFHTALKGW